MVHEHGYYFYILCVFDAKKANRFEAITSSRSVTEFVVWDCMLIMVWSIQL